MSAANDKKPRSRFSTAIRSISAGTAAGITCKVLEYPLDTIKVRLQTQYAPTLPGELPRRHFTGAWDCLTYTVKSEGLRSLYRGIMSPIGGSMMENAMLFFTYEQAKMFLTHRSTDGEFTLAHVAQAGAAAGVGTTLVLTPVELIKCKLQVRSSNSAAPATVFGMIRSVWSEYGLRGMYKGVGVTALREIPGNTVWFLTYEGVSRALTKRKTDKLPPNSAAPTLAAWEVVLAGGSAGVLYWTVPFPFDTAKSVLQTTEDRSLTLFGALKQIYRSRGVAGLYNGVGITVTRAFPSNAVIFLTYTQFNKLIEYFFD